MAERESNGVQLYCPDHPGPLDDARDHVCRLRPEPVTGDVLVERDGEWETVAVLQTSGFAFRDRRRVR